MTDDLQKNGVEKILPIGKIDEQEKTLLEAAVKELGPSIEKVRQLTIHSRDRQLIESGCFFPACSS